jgi:hypothetical protein
LDRFIVSAVVFSVAAVAAAYGLPDSIPLKAVAIVVIAIAAAVVAAYGWALIRAPYEQRNYLRTEIESVKERVGGLEERQDAIDERQRRLRGSRELTGETFYLWELVEPGKRPLISGRVFTDCIITGPALLMPGVRIDMDACYLGTGPIESLLYEGVDGIHQGIIGAVNCKFVRCRFDQIGFYAEPKVLEKLRHLPEI